MAKGNMLLGYARGSVGDVTFYRDGGLQRARARNRKPANPRSNKQQTQRALFANCVKFYKLTAAKFFKFAFENKAVNESDYNAFMRENVRRGVMMSRTAFYVEPYPALGNWLMSRGSLSTIDNANDDNTNAPMFDLGAVATSQPTASTTIAELSTAMIATGRYQVGDIITLIKYGADGEDIPSATPSTEYAQVFFNYYQFLIDPNNANTFASIFGDLQRFHLEVTSQGNLAIAFGTSSGSADEEWRLYWQGATVIHSRNTATGLKVSTQELTVNPRYQDAINTAVTDTNYKSAVLADWNAEGLAILQGDGLDLADATDYGEWTVGNKYDITYGNVTVGDESGVEVSDGYSLWVKSSQALTESQVLRLMQTAVENMDGLRWSANLQVVKTGGPVGMFIYTTTSDTMTVTAVPASLSIRQKDGTLQTASYTA